MASKTIKPTLANLIITGIPALKISGPASATEAFSAIKTLFSPIKSPIKPLHRRNPSFGAAVEVTGTKTEAKAAPAEAAVEKTVVEKTATAADPVTAPKCDGTTEPGASTILGVSEGVEYTSIGFDKTEELKWRLGDKDGAAVLAYFNPDTTLTPRERYILPPMLDGRDRAKAHEALKAVYGTRLIHETDRKDQRMHLWVPGSKLPYWLMKIHQRRSRNPLPQSKPSISENHASAETKQPQPGYGNKTGKHFNSHGNKNGYKGQPAMRAPRPQQDLTNVREEVKVWQGFASSAPKKYADDADAAAVASRVPQKDPEYEIKETFKAHKHQVKTIVEEAAPVPERKSALPPHLRKRAEVAGDE